MDCLWVREHLEGYLAGETSDGLSGQISEHLLSCDDCRGQAMQLTALTQRLRELPTRIVPQGGLAPASAAAMRPRRRRLLLAAVAVLAAWAAFSGALLLSPPLAERLAFLPLAGSLHAALGKRQQAERLAAGLRSENARLQRELDRRAALPVGALETVRALLTGQRGETATTVTPASLAKALAGTSGEKARGARVTAVDAVQGLPDAGLRLRLHVAVGYSDAATPVGKTLTVDLRQLPNGGWQVTRVNAP